MARLKPLSWPGCAVLLIAAALVVPTTASAQKGGNPNPGITVTPKSDQYRELSARWWQWALSRPVTKDPATTNPLVDTTGAAANNGQPHNGNVFFLAGLISFNSAVHGQVGRTITVPRGTRFFFPLQNFEQDNVGVNPPSSVAALRQLAATGAGQVTDLFASVDGVVLKDLHAYRAISPVFGYTLPPNDVASGSVNLAYAFTGGAVDVSGFQKPAVGDGFYVLLNPLPPGRHTIRFGGATTIPDANGNPTVSQLDVIYHVTVKRR